MKSIEKFKKFAEGGKIPKLLYGDLLTGIDEEDFQNYGIRYSMDNEELGNYDDWKFADDKVQANKDLLKLGRKTGYYGKDEAGNLLTRQEARWRLQDARLERQDLSREAGVLKGRLNASAEAFEDTMSTPEAKMGLNAGVGALQAADGILMGDQNFGAQSEAIDTAVHGVSSALMKSGNPYAMAAGAALEGANFLTKAGGLTVLGFDVGINSSGYGDLGHMESSSSRDFGAMIGLGGLNGKRMEAKLQQRNAQAKMAMNAANIAEEQSFEQEARANSIQNTIMNNNIALAGGLETNMLGG